MPNLTCFALSYRIVFLTRCFALSYRIVFLTTCFVLSYRIVFLTTCFALSYRIVFLTRSMTTPHFVCSMKELYVLMVVHLAIDGILHLMAQNVQNQPPLKELFTLDRLQSAPIVTAILKATVTRFLKVTYVWDSG